MSEKSTTSLENATEFTPPRHWIGMEELSQDYWADPKIQEKRGQEFHDKPIETLSLIEKLDTKGMARRDFLTVMGASMAMAGVSCARRPVHKIIPYVVKPNEITPGVANYYASSCPETGYGLLIKTREGRPIKMEGNPDHPVNRGALSARVQASVLDLYDPDRLKDPLIRPSLENSRRVATWSEVDQAIQAKLTSSSRVRVLSGQVVSGATRQLLGEFVRGFASGTQVSYEPLTLTEIVRAQKESYGLAVMPSYRFQDADVVVSLGADFLGAWDNSIEYSKDWSAKRKLDSKNSGSTRMSKLFCFESGFSVTGASADERFPIRPGDELKLALALAHELILRQHVSGHASDSNVAKLLSSYQPEAVANDIGLIGGAATIQKAAHALAQARGRGLVIAGGMGSRAGHSVELQLAVNLLNSALDNEGNTVDGTLNPGFDLVGGLDSVAQLVSEMNSGKVDVLIVYRSNPVFSLPIQMGFAEAMKKVPCVVVVAEHEDETSKLAHFVLAEPHFMENWGDVHTRKYFHSVQQPVLAPLYNTRAFQDSLLTWMKKGSWHDYLKTYWKENVHREWGGGLAFETFWENSLREGVVDGMKIKGLKNSKPSARRYMSTGLVNTPAFSASKSSGTVLSAYTKVSLWDGRNANNSWLQEMPDPISSIAWDNYVNLGPALAKQLNVSTHDVVEIQTSQGKIELPVNVQPGLHPQVAAIAVGYGRESAGKVGNAIGVNVLALATKEGSEWAFSGQPIQLRKTGRFYKLAATQWHFSAEGRPIINDVTLAEFKNQPSAQMHTNPHLRMETIPTMWPEHQYKGNRWGMAIDLSACTGCGACVIACQAENNIPVVGRENVRVSRQMHWIRIDRYYSGSPEQPDTLFQPMLCQHCENAPCETVCPVLATVHDDEGLNSQVYNRCVGTRYCQNNCPYKVRRFNFFDHWKSYVGNANLVWNPDVTVRTRGIMEKCTFCIQRINDGKRKAKDEGKPLADGAIKSACQQTCPNDAIVFGNMNDRQARVTKLKDDARAFRVLEVLNAKPSISYLTKVRNKEMGGHHS